MRYLIFIFVFCCASLLAQNDTTTIKVIFLYGSKPAKGSSGEIDHFGGLHGGHVSLEFEGMEYGFGPRNKFHILAHRKERHGRFSSSPTHGKTMAEGYKYLTVKIPIDQQQREELMKVLFAYEEQTPYDYAFFGMRCASNIHDILAQIGIMKKHANLVYIIQSFYPKRLRKRIIRLAEERSFSMEHQEGRTSRKWEKD